MKIETVQSRENAVIYARVSTDEQTKGYSLSTQIDACRDFAISRDYIVVAEFSDDFTGAAIDRPALDELRKRVSKGDVSVVIVYDIDRLARKAVYQMLIEEELTKLGIRVDYVRGQYDDSDEGRLQKHIRASIAEYEKAKIIERMKRGKGGKAKSGYVIVGARPPYGYRKISEPYKAWLEIVEEEARVIRMVYHLYIIEGLSIIGVAKHLTDLGIPTRGDKVKHVAKKHGFGVWSGGMIRHILTNETYVGIWYYGKTQMIEDGVKRPHVSKKGTGKQVSRPRDEWIAVEVPPIVDKELFDMAQERLALNKELAKRNTKHKYLLGRRLTCAKCGYTYVGRTRREKHTYYVCNGRQQTPVSVCDMPNFQGNQLDTIVWEWIKSLIKNPRMIAEGFADMQEETKRANSVLFERITVIEQKIAETEEQISKLLDLYLAGDFPRNILTERKCRLEDLLESLKNEHMSVSAHIQKAVYSKEQITELEHFCAAIRDGLDSASFKDKLRIFDLLNVRGKLAVENEEKVVYIKCLIAQQQLSVVATSLSSNTGATAIQKPASRPTVRFR